MVINGRNGVAGIFGGGLVNASDVTVTNSQISGHDKVGGIAALLLDDRTIKNATVTADSDSETTYKIYSDDGLAGGIVGMDLGLVKDSKVENITVETACGASPTEDTVEEDEGGAPEGFSPGNHGESIAIHGFFLNPAVNCTIENVTIINADE